MPLGGDHLPVGALDAYAALPDEVFTSLFGVQRFTLTLAVRNIVTDRS